MATTTTTTTPSSLDQWTKTLAVSDAVGKFGFSDDFTKGIYMPPNKVNQLTAGELATFLDNQAKSWDLYKDQKLTDLRGQISKELAQLNHVTETTKAKIAAKSALDVGRLESDSNFRNTLRTSLAASMQGFWS